MTEKILVIASNTAGPLQSPETILARMLGAEIGGPERIGDASLVVYSDPGLRSRVGAGARSVLHCSPDAALSQLEGISVSPGSQLVLQNPLHHLFATEALKVAPEALHLIPPAVDHRFFTPAGERSADLVLVPAITELDVALVAQVANAREGRLEILCEAGRRASVPAGLPGNLTVREAGPEERRDLLRRAAAVLIAPASRENTAGSQALLEAMACGAPVVMASSFGLEHLLVPEREGLLFPVGNVAEARAVLRQILSDAGVGRRLAQSARAKVEVALTCEHWAARMARICRAPKNASQPEFYLIAAHGVADSQEAPP